MTYKIYTCNLCDKNITRTERYINLKCIKPDNSRYEQRVHLKCYDSLNSFKPKKETKLKCGNE